MCMVEVCVKVVRTCRFIVAGRAYAAPARGPFHSAALPMEVWVENPGQGECSMTGRLDLRVREVCM